MCPKVIQRSVHRRHRAARSGLRPPSLMAGWAEGLDAERAVLHLPSRPSRPSGPIITADEPRSLCRRRRRPRARRTGGARHHRVDHGLHAAARGREDARVRRRPDRRHHRRRLLRERRVRQGARGDPAAARRSWSTTSSTTTSRRRPASSAAGRWTSTSSRSSRRPSSTSSAPATSGFHLARIAQEVGFRVHVADDREKFANVERFPTAARSSSTTFRRGSRATNLPPHAYVVIVTRGHTNDLEALRALAPRDLRYLGLIGSRAKVARIYEALSADDRCRRTRSRASTPRSASTSARSRRRRSPSASSPS